jgi:hypothetical protein
MYQKVYAVGFALFLLLFAAPAAYAQDAPPHGTGEPVEEKSASRTLFAPLDPRLVPGDGWSSPAAEISLARAPLLSKHLVTGGAIGAVAGALLGLAVVSFADCSSSTCNQERVVGVLGTTAAGAGVGALGGALVYLVRSAAAK